MTREHQGDVGSLWNKHWHNHIRFVLLGLVAGLIRIRNDGSGINLLTWPVNLWVGGQLWRITWEDIMSRGNGPA